MICMYKMTIIIASTAKRTSHHMTRMTAARTRIPRTVRSPRFRFASVSLSCITYKKHYNKKADANIQRLSGQSQEGNALQHGFVQPIATPHCYVADASHTYPVARAGYDVTLFVQCAENAGPQRLCGHTQRCTSLLRRQNMCSP
jgi:hypothetical protein